MTNARRSERAQRREVVGVKAQIGDKIVIRGHHVGDADHSGQVIAVRGPDGEPPYEVRWDDDGHEGLVFPGPDAVVEHLARKRAKSKSG